MKRSQFQTAERSMPSLSTYTLPARTPHSLETDGFSSNNISAKSRLEHPGKASRARGEGRSGPYRSFEPPERYHEFPEFERRPRIGNNKVNLSRAYHFKVDAPGEGYAHTVTPEQIVDRINALPSSFRDSALERLKIVHLSGMTHKKERYPLYGLQWGRAIYLYPLEAPDERGVISELFDSKPSTQVLQEVRKFGARVISEQDRKGCHWKIEWSPQNAADFFLNSVTIHELGHLIDDRNTSFVARERFADQMAIQYGTPSSQYLNEPVVRRHKSKVRYETD